MAVVGIRSEDKSVWERRVPIVPTDLARLSQQGIRFLVERSPRRCIADAEFEAAGAELVDELSEADVILGVKEVPADKILPGRAYLFFSHTIKGQSYNMPLLQRVLDLDCTLMDYELITDDRGVRTVAFGRHAGLAGCIDTLHALGQRLQQEGHTTALAQILPARAYDDVANAIDAIRQAAVRIAEEGLPEAISPLVIGVTGEGGKVWNGALEILTAAGAEEVQAEDLVSYVENFEGRARSLTYVSYDPRDLVEPTDDRHYSFQDYLDHPEFYRQRFGAHLGLLSAVVYGILWSEGYPKFILTDDVRTHWEAPGPMRLKVITDVTCDPGGSNELLDHTTEPGEPSYVVNPSTGELRNGLTGEGVAIWAVDILPAEIPVDASRHFSEVLSPMVPALARDDVRKRPADADFPDALRAAYIVVEGQLLPEWHDRLHESLTLHGRS
jgi:Alanine dehydrogenase/PNT, N-terminal domain